MRIISNTSYWAASRIAWSLGLKRGEWKFVSSHNIDHSGIRLELRGRRCHPHELVGYFTEAERWYLYGRYEDTTSCS